MICHPYRCVFVHVPKSADQSIEHVFLNMLGIPWSNREALLLRRKKRREEGPPRLAHLRASEYVPYGYMTQAEFDTYFKFAFVRNPWGRVVSMYKYLKQANTQEFKQFLFQQLKSDLWHSMYWFVRPEYEFIIDNEGKPLVDFVGRFETLQDDFNTVCRQLGLPETLVPHVNKSTSRAGESDNESQTSPAKNGGSYTTYYDREAQEFVAELYQADIQHFGYEFGR